MPNAKEIPTGRKPQPQHHAVLGFVSLEFVWRLKIGVWDFAARRSVVPDIFPK
jgi:hypothetical protein